MMLVSAPLVAQGASPYVPLHHWAMPYVEHLIARGVLADPAPLSRPLHADDLVRALEATDSARLNSAERRIVRDILRRLQGLATQSNLALLRFTPIGQKQQPLYLEVPYHITAEGSYHNLGLFFDRVSKFPRIINIGDISITAKARQEPSSTINADCTATTFVLQEGGRGGRGAPPAR